MHSGYRICLFLLAIVFVAACSVKTSRSVLTFFFDGVPSGKADSSILKPEDKQRYQPGDSIAKTSITRNNELFVHSPYKEKSCTVCHDENSKSELISPEPELCYACHTNFRESYKFLHGPVSGGFCTICHSPHMSENSKLLIRKSQQLCLYCHDKSSIMASEMHSDIGDTNCTECHNPHGGEDRYLIK